MVNKINPTALNVINNIKNFGSDAYNYTVNEHLERLLFTISYIKNNTLVSDSILDIGSGTAFVPNFLSLEGYENITIIDINDPPINADNKINSHKLDIEEDFLPFEDNSFNAILFLEVFEHLYKRPNHVFREVYRVLKKDGILIISTPNGGITRKLIRLLAKGKFDMPIYDFSLIYEKLGHFGHIREYSVREIKEYLKYFSFSIQKVLLNTFCTNEIDDNGRIYRSGSLFKKLYWRVCKIFHFLPIIQSNILLIAKK